ncbi:Hypothetical protein R9X50_00276400 [Acrodontium crateriforme]|uniref:P-loop containing nucleoside triphosphate hydrolase protein n=1 Tax=Acrodontium crateriforme TaxID=150365 RepID=A0AAQ3M7N4_9PEZI|nr:Hypothetical protein R9X50_00276400 [Acrodontium crateriforme]
MDKLSTTLENWVYPVPPLKSERRRKPMEILALGMSRSGTESLRGALQMLGYDKVYHGFDVAENDPQTFKAWTCLARHKFETIQSSPHEKGEHSLNAADFDTILARCVAVTDQQGAIFASELIKAYPEAKIILNSRDSHEWYESTVKTFGVHMQGFRYQVLPYFNARLYWRRRYYAEVLDAYFHGSLISNGKWVYEDHCAKVRGLGFAKGPGNFLEWQAKDGWSPLCEFLGKDVPIEEFPSGNRGEQTLSRITTYLKRDEEKAWMNLMAVVFSISVAMLSIWYQRQR